MTTITLTDIKPFTGETIIYLDVIRAVERLKTVDGIAIRPVSL